MSGRALAGNLAPGPNHDGQHRDYSAQNPADEFASLWEIRRNVSAFQSRITGVIVSLSQIGQPPQN
jgi:hypothetical protein